MIALNIIPLSELERKSGRFKNVPKPAKKELSEFKTICGALIKSAQNAGNERQTEEALTNFFASMFYDRSQLVPNENRMDYVIKSKQDGINKAIIEVKSQQNRNEFISPDNCNKKALWELILYFFNEVHKGNRQIKTLIATNGTEFYIFDAGKFYEIFAKGGLYKQYLNGLSAEYQADNNYFYNLAKQHIFSDDGTLDCVYFNIENSINPARDISKIYRLLSPAYLLTEITHTDANDINKNFYNELLHIIGLEEIKTKGSKITICRKGQERGRGSLFELAISEIHKKITSTEKAEAVALQLCIQWINRLLFLKLLETQICKYKESNKKFLDCENIKNFNDLNDLFFEVLGIETGKREQRFKDKYPQVPYLNSALFEASKTEEKNIQIRALRDNEILPYCPGTCLSIDKYNRTELTALQYLLKFLDSYNFSSTANEDTADNDKIINASILGRIFEKINGYKDGAVFTPSFITMYMCRETLQRAVIDKFNEKYGWKCADLTALYNNLDYSRHEEYNETINSLTVCDPAVGSGHFLVSALNEIIRIKSELGLLYHKGRKIKCSIDIQNDELVVSRGDEMFMYDYKDPDSQEIQECLFNEKKTIIENCLFGTDINPNSVNICRLRLWIELLKNTYYKPETGYKELETLPNIDINIKCGNSLISAIKIELGKGAEYKDKSIKSYIKAYKDYVRQYKETKDKGKKAELNNYISNIKKSLTPVFQPRIEYTEEDKKFNEEHEKNNIYKNSLEWMIEFPEILDDDGKFCGFDIIIGNPPYGVSIKGNEREELIKTLGHCPDYEIYYYFIELAQKLLKENKSLSYIIPNTWLFNVNASKYRISLNSKWKLDKIADCTKFKIFDGVSVYNSIIFFKKGKSNALSYLPTNGINDFESLINQEAKEIKWEKITTMNNNWGLAFRLSPKKLSLVELIANQPCHLEDSFDCSQGYIPYRLSDLIKTFGETEGNRIKKERLWHSVNKDENFWIQEVYGKDITKYTCIPSGEYVRYGKHVATYVDLRFFNQKRIVVREITNPCIIATIVTETLLNDPQLLPIITKNTKSHFTYEMLWALLNSKLATFYHFNHSPKATKGGFPKILITDLNNFPLPDIFTESNELSKNAKQLKSLAENVLSKKAEDKQADTSNLEHQIDLLVYKLYGLTYQEAKTIDPNLTETEFNKYSEGIK